MRPIALIGGVGLLPIAWVIAAAHWGMVGHMTAHMIAVAVAAPLVAYGVAGSPFDPARRWPMLTPLPASLVELLVVWGWHLPAARALASTPLGLLLEQGSFLAAGLALWSAVLSGGRAAGVLALLLTSMHMTLLGVLIGLAPQPLYGHHSMALGLDPLTDQQLGGVVMLLLGTGSYLIGGLAILATILRERAETA